MARRDEQDKAPDDPRIDPHQAVDEAEKRILGYATGQGDDADDTTDPVEGDSGTGVDDEPAD